MIDDREYANSDMRGASFTARKARSSVTAEKATVLLTAPLKPSKDDFEPRRPRREHGLKLVLLARVTSGGSLDYMIATLLRTNVLNFMKHFPALKVGFYLIE